LNFGVAATSKGFDNNNGIIGFGPVDLTKDTVTNLNEVPTFMQVLTKQGTIVRTL
jgi:hypothetical protein